MLQLLVAVHGIWGTPFIHMLEGSIKLVGGNSMLSHKSFLANPITYFVNIIPTSDNF
jgi:hypothetical protein